jgi:hypothetical protein
VVTSRNRKGWIGGSGFLPNSKRGNLGDIVFIMVFVFVLGLIIFISATLLGKINAQIQGGDMLSARGAAIIDRADNRFAGTFNTVWFIVFIGMWVATLVSAFFIRSHPVFYFVSLFVLIIFVLLAGILGNAFDDIASSEGMSEYSDSFTIINWFMGRFGAVIAVMSVVVAVILFNKGGGE